MTIKSSLQLTGHLFHMYDNAYVIIERLYLIMLLILLYSQMKGYLINSYHKLLLILVVTSTRLQRLECNLQQKTKQHLLVVDFFKYKYIFSMSESLINEWNSMNEWIRIKILLDFKPTLYTTVRDLRMFILNQSRPGGTLDWWYW